MFRRINRLERDDNMAKKKFQDSPPDKSYLTSYDEAHLTDYLRFLDAAEEGADWREVVNIIFEIDPEKDPIWAKSVYDSHIARARWMTEVGYAYLLGPRFN
jgi:Uncharacterized conserved protein (DUF2285)